MKQNSSERYIPGFWDATGAPRADVLSAWPSRGDLSVTTYDYGAMATDTEFTDACSGAQTQPTRRQYRKWTNRTGAAWAFAQQQKRLAS